MTIDNSSTKQVNDWWQGPVKMFSEVTGLIVVPIVGGLYGGRALDTKYGTEPWWFIICSMVGFGIAAIAVARLSIRYMKQVEKESKDKESK